MFICHVGGTLCPVFASFPATLRTVKQESSFLSWSGKGVIVWYCFVNNKAHSLGIAVNSGFSSVKKGFLPWDARFFTAKTVAVTVSCRDHALWRRSSWQRRRLSQRWRRSSCRQRGKSPLRYSGLRQYLFATGDSPGVQLFQNVRIFRFSITKESCLSFFLPCLFYRLLINSGLEEENVRHGSFRISFQIEKPSDKGYCLFC